MAEEPTPAGKFEENANVGLLREFWEFVKANRMWWIMPIVVLVLILAGVAVLGSSSAAPFIYTLF